MRHIKPVLTSMQRDQPGKECYAISYGANLIRFALESIKFHDRGRLERLVGCHT